VTWSTLLAVSPVAVSSPVVVTPAVVIAGLFAAAAVLVLPSRPRRHLPGSGPAEESQVDPPAEAEVDSEVESGAEGGAEPGPGPRVGSARWLFSQLRAQRMLPRRRRSARESPTAHDVAAAMALLALAYRTGLPTWQVLTAVARTTSGPVARDLRQVATALQWGADEAEAWAAVGEAWRPAGRVVVLSHAGGVAPGPLLTTAADDLNRAEVDRLEIAVAQVGVRLVAPMGLVLLPAFCLTSVVPLVVALGRQLLAG
jgi:hypothetical protein